ncbi:MAG TPA: DUF4340 domain-containing protein [Candidatus Polarisedimenticolia bacterium]|nr:DUF4340 domain-containing protein [Candidatus Polarisedimenticolia bacterium]
MRRWNLLIALGALLALSAYVWLVEIRGGEKGKKAKEESEKVLAFEKEQVVGLVLTHAGERIRLQKMNGKWRIQEPLQTAPDDSAVDELLSSLQGMRISHDLGKLEDPHSFNLAPPPVSLVLELSRPKPIPVLSLGDDAPTGGGTYARLGDQGKILIVSGSESVKNATLFTLRDKTLLKFDPAKLSGLTLVHGKDAISLAKPEGKWTIVAPFAAPAEDSTVSDLLSALEGLRVTEFIDEKPASELLKKHQLSPARLRATLHGEEWKSDPELDFGKAQAGSLFATHPASGALVKVSDSIQAKLNSSAKDLRRKEILPFAQWDLGRFRISGAAAQPLELKKNVDNGWVRVSPSAGVAAEEGVDHLLRTLTDLKAEEFLDRPAQSLSSLGLEPPGAKLEFWKQGEEGARPTVLRVGKSDGRGKIYFKDEAWPSVMQVKEEDWNSALAQARKVAQEKPKPAAAVQAPAAGASKPGKP